MKIGAMRADMSDCLYGIGGADTLKHFDFDTAKTGAGCYGLRLIETPVGDPARTYLQLNRQLYAKSRRWRDGESTTRAGRIAKVGAGGTAANAGAWRMIA